MPRKDRDLCRDFPGLTLVGTPPLTSVLALGVLADDDPVEVAVGGVAEGRLSATEDLCGADVGVLLKGLADCEAEAPE
jgi:hypothetical protein